MEIFGVNLPIWMILTPAILLLLYRNLTSTFSTFKKLGVPGPRPIVLFGTSWPFLRQGLFKHDLDLHRKYKKVAGTFLGKRPELMVFDLDILKHIFVKDFTNFRNRLAFETKQFPMDTMLTVLRDDRWKYVRNHVSPMFSGKKLRNMIHQVNRCGRTLSSHIEEAVKAGDMFEAKEYAGHFTMDVIASTSFNLDINSKKDQNSKFVRMAQQIFQLNRTSLALLVVVCCPSLIPYLSRLGLSLVPQEAVDFFLDITERSIKYREENPDENPKDFLDLMLSAKLDPEQEEELSKEKDKSEIWKRQGLTKEEILAQALIFFLAGYETSAVTVSFTMYNLAVNPECQERVYAEICDVLGENEEPDYDSIKKMKYLEMCVEETLRIYPPGPRTNREACEAIDINGVHIPAGMTVGISAYALHHDPEAWPEPEKFDPERFTEEAKSARHPCQYLPFGMGPRNCVAQRLALMEVKMALVHVIKKFKLGPCEKTSIPMQLAPVRMQAKNGVWLKAETRE